MIQAVCNVSVYVYAPLRVSAYSSMYICIRFDVCVVLEVAYLRTYFFKSYMQASRGKMNCKVGVLLFAVFKQNC